MELLVRAPDVLSVAPVEIDIVPVVLIRPLLTVSVPPVTFSTPALVMPAVPPFSVLVPLLVSVPAGDDAPGAGIAQCPTDKSDRAALLL